MKDNALYEVIGDKKVPHHRHIVKDEQIELRGPEAIEKCPHPLRRIEAEPANGRDSGLHHEPYRRASTIYDIYKDH
jgi:hypothetical protein